MSSGQQKSNIVKGHALIIGGTGMLSGVSKYLCTKYRTVSVIGRNKHRMYSLIRETEFLKGNVNPVIADYTDGDKFISLLEESIENFGNIELVVSWIHSTAPEASFKIAETISSAGKEFRYFDILGSASADPSADLSGRKDRFRKIENILYRKITLGFVIDNGSSRWLTNEEIANGVIEAIEKDNEETIIGTVTPWISRP